MSCALHTQTLLLAALMLAPLGSQIQSPSVSGTSSGTLVIQVHGLRNSDGRVRVYVFNRESGFPDDESAAFRSVVSGITAGQVEVRFDRLPVGDYAVSIHHDENDDAKMNRRLFGLPKEGYGVSNNVVHARRASRFDEARFSLSNVLHTVTIQVRY